MHTTAPCKASLDPKWNTHYDLYLSDGDGITISIWNNRKVRKKQGSGFLGCVRIVASMVQRLKDAGFQRLNLSKASVEDSDLVKGQIIISLVARDGFLNTGSVSNTTPLAVVGPCGDVRGPDNSNVPLLLPLSGSASLSILASTSTNGHPTEASTVDDRLGAGDHREATKTKTTTSNEVNIMNLSISESKSGVVTAVESNQMQQTPTSSKSPAVGTAQLSGSSSQVLPAGWEERRAPSGQKYYVNHVTQRTQWERPTTPAMNAGTGKQQAKDDGSVVSPSRVQSTVAAVATTSSNHENGG